MKRWLRNSSETDDVERSFDRHSVILVPAWNNVSEIAPTFIFRWRGLWWLPSRSVLSYYGAGLQMGVAGWSDYYMYMCVRGGGYILYVFMALDGLTFPAESWCCFVLLDKCFVRVCICSYLVSLLHFLNTADVYYKMNSLLRWIVHCYNNMQNMATAVWDLK
jgi:hypothetical protein